jgi:large subunit ribosomal protein L22
MSYKYSCKGEDEKKTAKAAGISLDISWKHSKMVSDFIRGMNAEDAVQVLEGVIAKKIAVPYPEYHRDLGHKTGIGPGRFPVKTCERIRDVLKGAIANAQHKGLNTSELVVKHISALQAAKPWHPGRHARRQMKRSHLQIMLEQVEGSGKKDKKESKSKKPAKETKAAAVKDDKKQKGAN